MEFSDYQLIRFERTGPVLKIILNRPDKLNAVNDVLHREMLTAFRDGDDDPESRVIVVTGAGRAFCAGGDVAGMAGRFSGDGGGAPHPETKVNWDGRHVIDSMLWVEKPVVAMVNGPASGLGATIALFCDVIFASTEATLSDRHVNVGLVAGDGGAVIWPLLVGVARAKEFLMSGRAVTGIEAERIGLVNRAVPPEELEAATMGFANELAALPVFAIRATKSAINRQLRRAVEDVLDLSLALERISFTTAEHREAVRQFMESRRR